MAPTSSGSNYSIQLNGSGPGHSSHKSRRAECHPRGEAQMEDAGASTSSQRPESLSLANNRDIPASVQELFYGSKTGRLGTSPKSLDRHHELISSSEEVHGSRKDRGTSEGLDTHVLQRTSPTDKILVEKPEHVIRRPEEEIVPWKGNQPSGSSPSLHKQTSASTSAKQAQENPKDQPEGQSKGKGKGKSKVEQALPAQLLEFQNKEEEILNQTFQNK
ncbi:hypothetical protein O181_131694 [Austropuccinia psidii MF-1]|uniref:Uncharacterized protein n=1 Tax=Austropuccinia psidii MF-1 TaxID=1389203 RepID=A0A9Q3QBB6_9BASI|nr:hypothetical protein [Austropuccinia psidii MF-1]